MPKGVYRHKKGKDSHSYKHGMYGTREYESWHHMLQRCLNKNNGNYMDYGGRGITVCRRWKDSFVNFYTDMGVRPKGLTLERLDNNKGYFSGNCKWVTYKQQASNRRPQKIQKRSIVGVKGISWAKKRQDYQIYKTIQGKRVYLGRCKTVGKAIEILQERA